MTAEEFRRKRENLQNRKDAPADEVKYVVLFLQKGFTVSLAASLLANMSIYQRIAACHCSSRPEVKKAKKKRKAKKLGPLSFDLDDGEGGGDDDHVDGQSDGEEREKKSLRKKKKIVKNPHVETDFLPDKEREQEEARERGRLRAEWEADQERIKSTDLLAPPPRTFAGSLTNHFALRKCGLQMRMLA